MDRMIVNLVKDPLAPLLDREIRAFPAGTSIAEALETMVPARPAGQEIVVNVEGLTLAMGADLSACRPSGNVVVCMAPGDNNFLRIAAQIAIIAGLIAYGQYYGVKLGTALGFTGTTAAAVGGAIITTGVMVTGNLLVNALLPAPSPDLTGGQPGLAASPTYGWNPGENLDQEGVPWPVLYGTTRIIPPILGKYIEVNGDKQYLHVLYAVADHAIDSIDESSIEINGNAITRGLPAETDGLQYEIRLGGNDQPVLQGFQDTRSTKTVGTKISTSWTTVETDGDAVEGLTVALGFPRGLYEVTAGGALAEHSVDLDVEYKKVGDSEWTALQMKNLTTVSVTTGRWSGGYYVGSDESGSSWYEMESGTTGPTDHVEGDVFIPTGWTEGVFAFGRPVYIWHWIANTTTYKAGELALDHVQVAGTKNSPIRRTWTKDRLTAGTYQIRVRFHDSVAPPSDLKYGNETYFDYIEEIIYDDVTYPGTSLFAIRALATDKLSNTMPRVSFIATRSTVPVWTGAAYENKAANLPAWQSYDKLHNSDYGGGLPYARINYSAFASWASCCTTKGYYSNVYHDAIINLRKALDLSGLLGEGVVSQLGGLSTCYIDQEVAYPVQSFLFNAGNTIRESYSEEWLPVDERANVVDVTFWDASNGYKRTTIAITAADYDETSQETKKNALELIGCTSRAEALKHGYRAINRNRYLTKTASWDVGIDSMGCLPWDPVVPPAGTDGRVVEATSTSVTLDKNVTLLPAHTYKIRVKKAADDTIEERTVAAVAEETITDVLDITETWTHTPLVYELYLLYDTDQDVRIMRILKITRRDDFTRRITAIEYNANALDDTGTVEAPETTATPATVSHLKAIETWKGGSDGLAMLSWTGFGSLWRIWYRVTGAVAWSFAGQTYYPYFEVAGLVFGQAYDFAVSGTASPEDGETVSLTIAGAAAWGRIAPDGSGWMGGSGIFTWDNEGEVNITGFKATSSSLSFTDSGHTTRISSGGDNAFEAGTTDDPEFYVTHTGQIHATYGFVGGWSLGLYHLWDLDSGDPNNNPGKGIILGVAGGEPSYRTRITVRSGTGEAGEVFRAGNLNGYLDYDENTWGMGVGVADNFLAYDITNGLRVYGDTAFAGGSFLVENSGGILIRDTSGQSVIRVGTDGGLKGLFIYSGKYLSTAESKGAADGDEEILTADGFRLTIAEADECSLARYTADEIYVGRSGHSLRYSIEDGLEVEGSITATTAYIGDGDHHLSFDAENGLQLHGDVNITVTNFTVTEEGEYAGGISFRNTAPLVIADALGGGGIVCVADPGEAMVASRRIGFIAFGAAYDDEHHTTNPAAVVAISTGTTWDATKTGAYLRFETTAPTVFGKYNTRQYGFYVHSSFLGASVPAGGGFSVGNSTADPGANNLWVENNCSALSYTDRTPYYEGDALEDIRNIRGKSAAAPLMARGLIVEKNASEIQREQIAEETTTEIDHATLPAFARKTVTRRVFIGDIESDDFIDEEVEHRDIGAMVSIHTVALQQLLDRIENLEKKGS